MHQFLKQFNQLGTFSRLDKQFHEGFGGSFGAIYQNPRLAHSAYRG